MGLIGEAGDRPFRRIGLWPRSAVGHLRERPDGYRRRCPDCKGSGLLPAIVKVTGMGKGMGSDFGDCPTCDGMGWQPGSREGNGVETPDWESRPRAG